MASAEAEHRETEHGVENENGEHRGYGTAVMGSGLVTFSRRPRCGGGTAYPPADLPPTTALWDLGTTRLLPSECTMRT